MNELDFFENTSIKLFNDTYDKIYNAYEKALLVNDIKIFGIETIDIKFTELLYILSAQMVCSLEHTKYMLYDALKIHFSKESNIKYRTYLIQNNDLIKIGHSKQVSDRFINIKSTNPDAILIAISERDVENELHIKYKDNRVKNEWFKINPIELKSIINNYDFKLMESIAWNHLDAKENHRR